MCPYKACLAHEYVFLKTHHLDFVKKELILKIHLKMLAVEFITPGLQIAFPTFQKTQNMAG